MNANRTSAALLSMVNASDFSAEAVINAAIAQHWGALSPGTLFVAGSAEVVRPSHGGDPWLSFDLDELRAGSYFRVTYSVFLSATGKPTEIFCSAPAGARLQSYGLTPGVRVRP